MKAKIHRAFVAALSLLWAFGSSGQGSPEPAEVSALSEAQVAAREESAWQAARLYPELAIDKSALRNEVIGLVVTQRFITKTPPAEWALPLAIVRQAARTVHVAPLSRRRITRYNALLKRLQIIVPEFSLHGAPVTEALAQVAAQARRLDPQKRELPLIVAEAVRRRPGDFTITVDFRNIPLGELLNYVTSLAFLHYRVTSRGIVVENRFGATELDLVKMTVKFSE